MIDVDASQMPSFLRGTWPDSDVEAALSWASSAVEAYCERDFSYQANHVVVVDPFPVRRAAQLPNPPVISVSLVEAFILGDNGALTWQPLTNYAWTSEGLIYDTTGLPGVAADGLWPSLPKSLRVTYSHGFQTPPQPLVDAVVKMAAGYLANPYNVNGRKAGDVEANWSVSIMQSLGSELDVELLSRYRLITVTR